MLCLGEGIYKMNSDHLIVAEKGNVKMSWGRGVAEVTSCLQRTQKRKILLCCSFICSFGPSIQYKSFLVCLPRKRFVNSDGNGKSVNWWILV